MLKMAPQYLSVFFGLWICLQGVAPKLASADAANPGTFTFRLPADPETLDWNRAHTAIETYILTNIMDGLVTHDANLKVVPALAQSWTKSADGKVYTFKLRPGVAWSDGVPLKAQDFVYSWKRLLSPITAASYAYLLFDVEGAEDFYKGKNKDFAAVGIKALDNSTFQVKLNKPMAHFIHIPSFWVTYPMRQDVVEKNGTSWSKPGRIVTLGAFTLSEYDADSRIVLKANHTYYNKSGNVETAVALIIKEDSTALTLYETGKLDFLTDISSLDLKRLAGRKDLKVFPYLKTAYLGFAENKFPMNNPKVRRAIVMAIDRKKISEFLHAEQTLATSFVPPHMMAHDPKMGLPFDPAAAKVELRNAGLEPGKTLELDLVCANWDKPLLIAQFIQSELKKHLGINVQIQSFDHRTFRGQMELNAYPLFITSWSADYPDPDNFLSVFLSFSGNNRTTWKNASYDEKVLAARTNQDPKAREKLYIAAQKILVQDEAVIGPLFYEPNIALVSPRVKVVDLNPLNDLILEKVILGH